MPTVESLPVHPIVGLPSPRSLAVRLDLTNKCNLRCIHCVLEMSREARNEPRAQMPIELFHKLSKELFPYAYSVALSCEAEPMIHTRFLDVIDVISKTPGAACVLTTNGTVMTQEKARAMLDAGICHICISLDGATDATFERIRPRGKFDKVRNGIEMIRDMKQSLGRGRDDFPCLQVNFTLMRSTLPELPLMVDLCHEWQVHRLTVQHLYDTHLNKLHDESLVHDKELSDSILRTCQEKCDDYGIKTTFPPFFKTSEDNGIQCSKTIETHTNQEAMSCLAPWKMVRIRCNGDVVPCDLWHSEILGNLQDQSFEEIWNGPRYVDLRKGLARQGPPHGNCSDCSMMTTDNLEGKKGSVVLVNTPGAQGSEPK